MFYFEKQLVQEVPVWIVTVWFHVGRQTFGCTHSKRLRAC